MKKCRWCIFVLLMLATMGCGAALPDYSDTSTTDPPVEPPPGNQRSFQLLPMHDDLLLRTGYLPEEAGGLRTVEVTVIDGDALQLSSTATFKKSQLVVVESDADEYVTGKVKRVRNGKITLDMAADFIGRPIRVHNFYNDNIHPNLMGYRAIADFAVRTAGLDVVNSGKHVVIGDSWIDFEGIVERMSVLLPNATIINEGVAGNRISQVISRFDQDVTAHAPDFVWVLVGTNDYRDRKPAAYYAEKILEVVDAIRAIDAVPIIFDPSVGPREAKGYADYEMTYLSHDYAEAVARLP